MDEILEQKIKKRQEYNIKILDILAEQVERYPQLRLGQILINTDVLENYCMDPSGYHIFDPFNEEPVDMYNRIMERQRQRQRQCERQCQSECEQEK